MTPIRSRRPAILLAVLTAVILLGGCSSEDAAEPGAAGSAAAGVTSPGAPAGSTEAVGVPTTDVTSTPPPAEPQDVATDPDPEPSSGSDTGVVPDVEVVTSYAGWDATSGDVAAAGYVTGVVEDGGTCTLTLSRSGQEVVVEAPGLADASTTACGGLEVAGTALAPGQWSAVLAYRSDAASGTAEPVRVDVP